MRKIWALALVVTLLSAPATALASTIGVGVGTGRIEVSEQLRSGGIYKLPPVTVFNTGDKTATYTMSVTLNEKQPQLKPKPEWFSFSPDTFTLAPGKAQVVTPSFHPPLVTKPGKYFAYLEAHPDKTAKQGTTQVGVAAATKLSFTVVASNIFVAMLFRLAALYRQFEPWSQIVTGLIVAGVVISLMNKYLLNVPAALKAAWQAGRRRRKN